MTITPKRRKELCKAVRDQLEYYLTESLEGSEVIMKEAWEQADSDEELKVMDGELKRLRRLLVGGEYGP